MFAHLLDVSGLQLSGACNFPGREALACHARTAEDALLKTAQPRELLLQELLQ